MIAEIRLWGRTIGALSMEAGRDLAAFQYAADFATSGIQLSPLVMPLNVRVYEFPELPQGSFHGLPGLLADSLPDKFGNALIDAWLAIQGRSPASLNALERLCYTGSRGMGALEFAPAKGPQPRNSTKIEIDELAQLAAEILAQRGDIKASLAIGDRQQALNDILRVGTSAGGARAKAVIAWNPKTDEVRSGQVDVDRGFEHWLLKFDGVKGNRDKELEDPEGFGAIEYAYSLMAKAAGIQMSACRLLEEAGRRHFMTRRFDRLPGGEKLHMQSLSALAHYDFNQAGAYSYEQALRVIQQLGLPKQASEEQLRRMIFNVVARNQDDHVKNIAFLMDKAGVWSLAPAFDMTYSYNPSGTWTASHQMTINGKRDDFTLEDLKACAKLAGLKRGQAKSILGEVQEVVSQWSSFAGESGVSEQLAAQIKSTHRLKIEEH